MADSAVMYKATETTPDVEIVIPVFNEERDLASSVERLHAYLSADFPLTWKISIADNASTDATLEVAHELAGRLSGVDVIHLAKKGRGRALRVAWSASHARVVAYMDADLSTDLTALLPLVAPLLSGHSELAIGTRLTKSSRVARGPKREFISRTYNRLLKTSLRARFSDAQCGFKAIRGDVAAKILPLVKDNEWFFDTELLIVAQREGLRIHEVPVDWIDDPNSKVEIVNTALKDLRGMARLAWEGNVLRFLLVGVLSTLAYAAIFVVLREPLGAVWANFTALAITAVANTAANRHFTFGVEGRRGAIREYALAMSVFVLTLLLTNAALWMLHQTQPDASRELQLLILTLANVAATLTRYVALRFHIFAHGRRVPPPPPGERELQANRNLDIQLKEVR